MSRHLPHSHTSTSSAAPDPSSTGTRRRRFLGRLAAGLAGLAAGVTAPRAIAAMETLPASSTDDWMDALTGKHRAVMDIAAHKEGKPLTQAKNYLDAWHDALHVPATEVNLVLGIHGDGIPFVLSDATWARLRIGEHYDIRDAGTKAPATRNVFSASHIVPNGPVTADQTIEALQRRGVRVLICMNTIAGASKKLAAAGMGTSAEVRSVLLNGLLPGVIAVPAMMVALTQLQERGVGYIKVA